MTSVFTCYGDWEFHQKIKRDEKCGHVSFDWVFHADSKYHDFITQNMFFDEENWELPAEM